jgi:hypothetical protein
LGQNGCADYILNPKRAPTIFNFLIFFVYFILRNILVTYFLAERWYNWGTPAEA